MANYKDLLNKNKNRLEQMDKPRKKIKRKGPKRPWQENLEKYQEDSPIEEISKDSSSSKSKNSESKSLNDGLISQSNSLSKDQGQAVVSSNDSPTNDIANSKIGDSRASTDTKPTQHRHISDTKPTLGKSSSNTIDGTIPTQKENSISVKSAKNQNELSDTIPAQVDNHSRHKTSSQISKKPAQHRHNADTQNTPLEPAYKLRDKSTDTMPTQNDFNGSGTIPTQVNDKHQHNTDTEGAGGNSSSPRTPKKNTRHNTNTNNIQEKAITDTEASTTPTQLEHKGDTEQTQRQHNNDTIPTPSSTQKQHSLLDNTDTVSSRLRILKGQKLKVFHYCYETTVANNYNPFRVSYDSLSVATGIPNGSIRTTTKRLKNEGLIHLEALGKGRGALLEICVPDIACKMYTRNLNTNTIPTQSRPNNQHNAVTATDTNLSSSSSNLINNTNTNYEEKNELSGEWLEIITPESLKEINFGKTQILQLKRVGGLSPDEVQESLDAFAYDLEAGKVKSFGSKLGFLMGILRKGNSYISEAYMNEMRAAYERQKSLRDEKAQLEKQQMEERLSKKAKEEYEKLSDDQKKELVPENNLAKVNSQVHERMVLAKLIESIGQKGSGRGEI